MQPASRFLALAALIATAMAVAGCAVTPKPFEQAEIEERAQDNMARVTAEQEPVRGAIDLYEAMARALKYNLDHKVEVMEGALRIRELDLAHFSLLPNVVANSGYAARDNYNASNSVNILTGKESLANSTSQEKKIKSADISFSWNILDFGLSYVRARQAADEFLIANELRRKVAHRIIEDVRTSYWRAVSADRLLTRLRSLEGRVRAVQSSARAMSDDRQTSPITAVTYERELVEIKRTIQELERDLVVAKTQLSSLMNLPPGTPFMLLGAPKGHADLAIKLSVGDMIWIALNNRSELHEVWYRQRINMHDLDAAFLELLPGLQVYSGSNYDSNDFLYNNDWVNWGAKAAWNLIRIVQYPAKREVIEAKDGLLDERSLAVTMAIMTQVHVSRVRFYHFSRELATSEEYLGVQRRLVELMRAEAAADRVSEQTLIREEMNTLVAEVKRDIAYAALQNAFANVYASMGLDPLDVNLGPDTDVASLARSLRSLWFERGDFSARQGMRTAAN